MPNLQEFAFIDIICCSKNVGICDHALIHLSQRTKTTNIKRLKHMSCMWRKAQKNNLIVDTILNCLGCDMGVVAVNNENLILALQRCHCMAIEVLFNVSF